MSTCVFYLKTQNRIYSTIIHGQKKIYRTFELSRPTAYNIIVGMVQNCNITVASYGDEFFLKTQAPRYTYSQVKSKQTHILITVILMHIKIKQIYLNLFLIYKNY